ncbi:signal recognition particle, SRP9/SRP14 subunit [Sistotremastrum niveocremeum HHB9708]|uniref:Signal recognition particle subunit SRP14 n=1 Tax=Sistotremastrum niveocremeum HHB9708 TaxID=1314777 RepID=A0A164UF27_9AGAM|nr:signal recognition particle, SRP9/SRP14 subunit [Sistotremastrum niveocremeum HHB9708]
MRTVDNETFLAELSALFKQNKGTVWLTHKRLTHDGADIAMTEGPTSTYDCLLRASNGDDVKFSTRIKPEELLKFHSIYGALLKSSMTSLRKRDKKREKQRAEQVVLRKQKLTQPIVLEGPKRGNGRRKRQRRLKAALKQAASLKKIGQ